MGTVASGGPEGTTGEFSNKPGGLSCAVSAGVAASATANPMLERFNGSALNAFGIDMM